MGKIIADYPVKENEGRLQLDKQLSPGFYFIHYREEITALSKKLSFNKTN